MPLTEYALPEMPDHLLLEVQDGIRSMGIRVRGLAHYINELPAPGGELTEQRHTLVDMLREYDAQLQRLHLSAERLARHRKRLMQMTNQWLDDLEASR